jgi:hypothetical protein
MMSTLGSDGASNRRTIDVSGVQPSAQSILSRVAEIYLDQLGDALISLVAHGSAVKGGIIEGSSDVDYVVLVSPDILTSCGEFPLERSVAIHRTLSTIDPEPFRYVQGYADAWGDPTARRFIEGTYHVVVGEPDVPVWTGEDLLNAARQAILDLDPARYRGRLSNALLDHGEERLNRQVRYLCTDVWPVMYHVASVALGDGPNAWQHTKPEVVQMLANDPIVGAPLTRWMNAISEHYAVGETVDTGLRAIESGVSFLESVADWRESVDPDPTS